MHMPHLSLCFILVYLEKYSDTANGGGNDVSFTIDSYSEQFLISSTDTDAYYECRPASLLAYIQRVITEHAQLTGTSRDDVMAKYNSYWMVLRIWISMRRPVIWGETLTVRMTVRRPHGTRVYRDCDLYIGDEQIGEATSMWVLANRRTKRPILLESLPELPKEDAGSAKSITLSRVVFPENMSLHHRRELFYSDTDINGHINNTRYVDLACDAAELNLRPHGVFMKELLISYVGECFAGEELSIYRGKKGDTLFIHGVGPDQTDRFDCTIQMSSDEGM